MKKEERIRRYGKAAWEKHNQQSREWNEKNPEKVRTSVRLYALRNPEKVKAKNREKGRKGGKYYEKAKEYDRTGLRRERNLVRGKHGQRYRPYKKIMAPKSQIHHEWLPETANYRGVALVEKDAHMYGFVDVIQILEGKITLLTEEEIRGT